MNFPLQATQRNRYGVCESHQNLGWDTPRKLVPSCVKHDRELQPVEAKVIKDDSSCTGGVDSRR